MNESVLDWFGSGYVLLLGPACDLDSWSSAAAELPPGVPIAVRQLPADASIGPYGEDAAVLVRPDGVIAQCRRGSENAAEISEFFRFVPSLHD